MKPLNSFMVLYINFFGEYSISSILPSILNSVSLFERLNLDTSIIASLLYRYCEVIPSPHLQSLLYITYL